jgi:type IV secretion system protein VirD4
MVSRQETARPLLTPGEIMQLPAGDEIVLVSGSPPVRAQKARYYDDPQLKARVIAPPKPGGPARTPPAVDDWSAQPVIAAPRPARPARGAKDDDGGIRREPALPEHEQVAPEPGPLPEKEFAFLDEEADDDAARARAMTARMRGVARQAALDPDDGIAL